MSEDLSIKKGRYVGVFPQILFNFCFRSRERIYSGIEQMPVTGVETFDF